MDGMGCFSNMYIYLVGGWTNPFEKYAEGKLDHETPGIGVKIPKIFELPPPSYFLLYIWKSNRLPHSVPWNPDEQTMFHKGISDPENKNPF